MTRQELFASKEGCPQCCGGESGNTPSDAVLAAGRGAGRVFACTPPPPCFGAGRPAPPGKRKYLSRKLRPARVLSNQRRHTAGREGKAYQTEATGPTRTYCVGVSGGAINANHQRMTSWTAVTARAWHGLSCLPATACYNSCSHYHYGVRPTLSVEQSARFRNLRL